ncbi:MAG: type II secretion system protein GspJ [Candidatus Omnitrophota bacterium]|jgi:prepilin-type N-terminal cleavage/methylation domain-containing protein
MRYLSPGNNGKGGFTLIELLITASIVAFISLAIYSTLDNGVKIWRRASASIPEEDYALFFDKFGRELRNTLKFSPVSFFGSRERLEFPSLVRFGEAGVDAPGKIIYDYDPQKGALQKWRLDISDSYSGREGAPEEALRGVRALNFRYYYYDKESKELLWSDDWPGKDPPLAVRLELEFTGDGQDSVIAKTVSIPVAG